MNYSLIIKIVFLFILILLAAGLFLTFSKDYDAWVYFLLNKYDRLDKYEEFRTLYFTPRRFLGLKYFLCFLIILSGWFFFNIKKYTDTLSWFFSAIKNFILLCFFRLKIILTSLTASQQLIFYGALFLLVCIRIYYFFQIPLFIDEAFSYTYFVSKGFLVSASYYPGPNNHILYSEFCGFFGLFIDDPVLAMRLPSFIFSILLSLLLFVFLYSYFGFSHAFLSFVFFSFSTRVQYYSLQGRGFILLAFFALLAAIAAVKIAEGKNSRAYWLIYVVASSLGFYTITVFLYPFLSLNFFLIAFIVKNKDRNTFQQYLIASCLVAALVLLLYFPVMLIHGPEVLFNNPWVQPLSFRNFMNLFPEYLLSTGESFWSNEPTGLFWTIGFFLSGTYILLKEKNHKWAWLLFSLILLPFIFIIIHSVLPGERVWTYLIVFFSMSFSFVVIKFINFISNLRLRFFIFLLACFIVFVHSAYSFDKFVKKGFPYYKHLNAFLENIPDEANSFYIREDAYRVFIRYKFERNGRAMRLEAGEYNPGAGYDYVVIPAKGYFFPDAKEFELVESNPYVNIYKSRF